MTIVEERLVFALLWYLMTPVKGHYLYLFMVLDEYSRKIVR